jgi:hypothetical protein
MQAYFIYLATSVIVGWVCAAIAYRTGRDPIRWFLIGAALNIAALAVITLVQNRKARKPDVLGQNRHAARG